MPAIRASNGALGGETENNINNIMVISNSSMIGVYIGGNFKKQQDLERSQREFTIPKTASESINLWF